MKNSLIKCEVFGSINKIEMFPWKCVWLLIINEQTSGKRQRLKELVKIQ